MTLLERIHRAGQGVEPGWDDRDVERVWQGLKRKRRRRAVAAGAGVAVVATAGIAVWALFVSGRAAVVGPAGSSASATAGAESRAPSRRDETMHLADGSTALPLGGHEASLTVVENNPQRVVVALARGAARFDVVPRAARVFAVRAGDVTVSVLGTAFSVERVADRVGVTVTRGTVQVEWGTGSRRLAAGDEGWFPPLVVSSAPDGGQAGRQAEDAAKDAPPARSKRKPVSEAAAPRVPAAAPAPVAPATAEPAAPALAPVANAATLLADADRARLGGRFEEGASLLRRLVREHPDDQRAPVAAFSLGRILLGELRRPVEAAQAFARVRTLAPDGPLAEDALAREVEAWARAGDLDSGAGAWRRISPHLSERNARRRRDRGDETPSVRARRAVLALLPVLLVWGRAAREARAGAALPSIPPAGGELPPRMGLRDPPDARGGARR